MAITSAQKKEAIRLTIKGLTRHEVCKIVNISKSTLQKILSPMGFLDEKKSEIAKIANAKWKERIGVHQRRDL